MSTDESRRRYLQIVAGGASAALAGCSAFSVPGGGDGSGDDSDDDENRQALVDDWEYSPDDDEGIVSTITQSFQSGTAVSGSADVADGGDLGFATGGAKDISTFRRNVDEGYLPLPESLATEGLYYDYYFDTGEEGACSSLFCPSYSSAVTADPLSGETERYLTVGLNSELDQDSFERKKLNLVVVLDVSGSMTAQFDEYYYDQYGNRQTPEGETGVSKIQVARDALVALTEQLAPEDRFGVVLFESQAHLAKPLRKVEETDMDAIRAHIQEDVVADGGTNMAAGLEAGMDLLAEYEDADPTEYENRVIFLTDAMPNVGETSDTALQTELSESAEDGRYTTFVGIGLDFNAELIDELTATRGANYYSVHSADEFERRLGDEFEYMVTPLVFDLELALDAQGYDVEAVYGSTAADEATGQLMQVNTLFPSPREGGETRGGVVLVQVSRTGGDSGDEDFTLRASWEDRTGTAAETTTTITFPETEPEHFANTGVRKATLLARYADLLRNWMVYERDPELTHDEDGIEVPPEGLNEWEQRSDPLTVSGRYEGRITEFREHFAAEATAIGDDSLDQEVETMDTILEAA